MGLKTTIHAAPDLLVKVQYPDDNSAEKIIGYATNLIYTVTQGQKPILTVDSPFPAEIAQSAGPSMVRGSLTLYLPKGSTPERAGLIPFRVDDAGNNSLASTKYINIRIYDRLTSGLIMALDFCKFGQYTMAVQARQVVRVDIQFEGYFATPGNGG